MKTIKWQELYDGIFLIEDESLGVVYAPLLGKFFQVSADGLRIIRDFIRNNKPDTYDFYQYLDANGFFQEVELPRTASEGPFNSREMTISVTTACNLRCIYCYARGGTLFVNLPWEKIAVSIRQMYQYAIQRGDKGVELSFHGTGESTLKWEVMVRAVEYALELLPNGWSIDFTLVTNGTLITDEKARFLAKHKFSVVLSMDGSEKVQNQLRPKADGSGSFDDALQGARNLVKHEVHFAMRSTITGYNQGGMMEFLELCASIGCKTISVAPFSLTGRGEDGVPDIDPLKFVEHYIQAKVRASELGVDFSMPSDYLDNVSARYCNADGETMAVMPDGNVSCCTRVTNESDSLSWMFFVGKVTETGVHIDQAKVDALKTLNLYNFPECSGCFAKYTCGGGCHHTRIINGFVQPANYCHMMRGVLWNTLKLATTVE